MTLGALLTPTGIDSPQNASRKGKLMKNVGNESLMRRRNVGNEFPAG